MFSNMTLEDFFTLKEMKDGLTTPTRVEELIDVMRKQKDNATSVVVDATIVANTLSSTDNMECLNHFIYLDGLFFLNQWLQEALKFPEDITDGEGLIKVLLSSLEKLPVDRQKLNASGIFVTVEKLFGYEIVKERAQILFEKWSNDHDDVVDAAAIEDSPCQTETMEVSNLQSSEELSIPSAGEAENVEEDEELCCEPTLKSCKEGDASTKVEKSDSEADSGEFDALEVARRVAIQVEREVVDYREQSTSSPEVSSRETNAISDTARSPKTELESEAKAENKLDIDLNADLCSEDPDCAIYFSTPIAVSATKGSPGLPVAPLHFEGELGWRGSAATSAFRPASPRSKRKASLLEIDLNVADGESDANLLPISVIPNGIPSRDSSIEVSSERVKRRHLDLNSVGEEEEEEEDPTSSSTSRVNMPVSVRNFDLNESPSPGMRPGYFENGSREGGNAKHFFMPGNGYLLEEQRKETDPGFAYGYNQVNPWH